MALKYINIITNIYQIITDSGVQILVFLAAMQSIPKSIYESSQIEGATGWESFWKITFPLLSPFILTNFVYTAVDYFSSYKNPIMSVIMYTTQEDVNMDLSYGLAMAMIYFAVVAVILIVIITTLTKIVFYEDRK